MNAMQLFRQGAAWLAISGMCLPGSIVFGNEAGAVPRGVTSTSPSAPVMHDVALRPGGLLVGQVLEKTLQPMRRAGVVIQLNGQTAAAATTDATGSFAVAGLRGGVHQVVVGEAVENCRLWAAGTAPPHAATHLRLVPGQNDVVRGQWGPPPSYNAMMGFFTNPWVIGGVVATAIAVPVILNNTDDDDDEGS